MLGLKHNARRAVSRWHAAFFGSIVSVDTHSKKVALTFDDGPHPEFTPKILDLLSKYDAKATFFMLGVMAEKYPHLLKIIVNNGHEIGNHSWDHQSFLTLSAREIKIQLTKTKQILAPFGQSLMRPPFGHQNLRTYLYARHCGYKVINWNLVLEDWLDHNADWLSGNLVKKIQPGSIILLHDNLYQAFEGKYRNRDATIGAVEVALKSLPEYEFVTVSELLASGTQVKLYWSKPLPDDFLICLKANDEI